MKNNGILKAFVLALGLTMIGVAAYALDYPHYYINTIECADCHKKHSDPDGLMPPVNNLCWSCHNDQVNPFEKNHIAPAATECVTCHDPHEQEQVWDYYEESDPKYDPKYAFKTGTVNSVTPTILTKTVGPPGWGDNELVGFVVYPNIAEMNYNSYKITGNDSNSLTVAGTIDIDKVTAGDTFAIVYGRLIRSSITTPNSGDKPVKFFDNTGSNSFADGDTAYDGVCEVCHTLTRYWRTDGSGLTHYTGAKCTTCHPHTGGFGAACDVCHGHPPVDTDTLVFDPPGGTESTTAGAHDAHVTTNGFLCNDCHVDNVASGLHNNGLTITMGFSPFGGGYEGGIYDGQTDLSYDSSHSDTTVSDLGTGSKTCTNLYCHGNYDGSGLNASAVWSDPSSAVCGTCHGASNPIPPDDSGNHERHAKNGLWDDGTSRSLNNREYACTMCHVGIIAGTGPSSYTVADRTRHVNGTVDWGFDANDSRLQGGSETYSIVSGSAVPSDGTTPRAYGTCDAVYCHSSVQTSSGGALTGLPGEYTTPTWGTVTGCEGCHVETGANAQARHTKISSGSHAAHSRYITKPNGCLNCHDWTNSVNSFSNSCRNNFCHDHGGEKTYHVNGSVDLIFASHLGASAAYNGTSAPGDGYDNCSNTYCHSNGTSVSTGTIPDNTSSDWGSGVLACDACHGNGPDYDNGSPNKANSHVAHSSYTCNTCHYGTTTTGNTITNETKHVNWAYDLEAGSGISFSYSFDAGGGTCSNIIFCHGGNSATWGTLLSCSDSCHGLPPDSGAFPNTAGSHATHMSGTNGPGITDCFVCHANVSESTHTNEFTTFASGVDADVNGNIDLDETDVCDTCHSPDGPFDGVAEGKTNWSTATAVSCEGCHDTGTSTIQGVSALPVAGDNATWGYYATGHGRTSIITCTDCHDPTSVHFDGLARTYAFDSADYAPAQSGVAYASGYRLQDVGGEAPLMIPANYNITFSYNAALMRDTAFRLCFSCHDASLLFDDTPGDGIDSNFKASLPNPPRNYSYAWGSGADVNEHVSHIMNYIGPFADSDWDTATDGPGGSNGNDSLTACSNCHNVHGAAGIEGSTNEAMIRDGSLAGRAGYGFSYVIEDVGAGGYPWVTSTDARRSTSVGAIFRSNTANMCGGSMCHGDPAPPGGTSYDATGSSWGTYLEYYRPPTVICTAACHGQPPDGDTAPNRVGSHATHFTSTNGPQIAPGTCDDCHLFSTTTHNNGEVTFADSLPLAATNACDVCHSPDGTYNGVNDAAIGAKDNWSTGVYTGNSLTSGKEKWCATCHDDSPAVIQSVSAPNIIGDEDGAYIYGTGWGYYKTGHGLPSGEAYPYKGGLIEPPLVGGASRSVECEACHDLSTSHTDGLTRTFDDGDSSGTDPSVYRQGYRLKLVGGQEPMQVPWKKDTVNLPNAAARYRLCAECHDTLPFTNSTNTDTNLVTGGINRHEDHLALADVKYAADWDPGYDGAGATSRITCVNCHNVHGSTQLAMVRDGKLTNREPGLKMWYYDEDTVVVNESNSEPPDPEDTPLAASDGTIWRGDTSGNLCSHCHHNDNTLKESRIPYQDVSQSPTLDWTGEGGYVTDGVNPDNATAKSYFEFRVKYTDKNNDPPSPIQVWVDINDNDTYEGGEMYAMAETDPSDINYTDGKIYTFAMSLSKFGDNTFNYRFYASDGALNVELPTAPDPDKTVTVTNNSPVLAWTGETYYESFGVHPAIGKDGENFTFRITYSDIAGDAPTLGQVWIDANENGSYEAGEKHDMTVVSGDYSTGMIYSYSTTLNYVTDGTVDYTFRFDDGTDSAAGETGPLSDNVVTVANSTNNPPRLDWVVEDCSTNGAKPVKGLAAGDFTFKVTYTDLDNQCPPTASDIQVVVNGTSYDLDQNDGAACNAGRTYYTTLQLGTVGDLDYYFTANDGTDTATGDPTVTSGKQVTVVSTANAVGVRTGSGDTAPWYNSIQAAVTATGANMTVLVYDGTYNENVTIDDAPDADEGIILESVCGAELTTINGSGGNAVFVQNISTSATIDGFTITGGSNGISLNIANLSVKNSIIENNSRGINSSNTINQLTVEDTIIRNNTGDVSGAGIYINGGSGHSISDSTIEDNTANYNSSVPGSGSGGGVYIQTGADVTITDTSISDNSSDLSGGGIYLNNSSTTLTRTTVSSNTSDTTGGGLFLQGTGSSSLSNCNVVDNSANTMGGGFDLNNYTSNITNCTVSSNSLSDTTNGMGGGMYANNPTLSITNSVFWANEAAGKGSGHECFTNNGAPITFSYSDVPNNLNALATSGTGSFSVDATNIDTDPLFTGGSPFDYHLKSVSPAIDVATDSGAPSDDIDGDSRPQPSGGDYDMGSDEYSTEGLETESPVVTGFTATTPSNNRNVPVTLFTATDNVAVTGYAITTSAVPRLSAARAGPEPHPLRTR